MQAGNDGMMVVRAELCDKLDSLQHAAATMTVRDFSRRLATIRTMAAAYGLIPVVSVADAFDRAVRAQPRFCPARLYFDCLRDAIGCERIDDQAAETLLASVSIQLRA